MNMATQKEGFILYRNLAAAAAAAASSLQTRRFAIQLPSSD